SPSAIRATRSSLACFIHRRRRSVSSRGFTSPAPPRGNATEAKVTFLPSQPFTRAGGGFRAGVPWIFAGKVFVSLGYGFRYRICAAFRRGCGQRSSSGLQIPFRAGEPLVRVPPVPVCGGYGRLRVPRRLLASTEPAVAWPR